jgi:lysozyme
MKSTNYAILLIKSFEQLRLNSYLCPAGKWTIGYGHTDGVNRGMLITEKTADAFLKQDIKHAEDEVNRIDADLTQEQFDALVSFVFNVGTQAFRVSTLRKLVERNPGDPKIADEFRRWVYAGDKKLPGLIKRREQEIKLYYS